MCSTSSTAGANITFNNNIIWHSDARAQSVLIADDPLNNITIQNNLDIEDPACETNSNCYTSPYFVEGMHGLTFQHNTSVNPAWSLVFGHVYSYTYSDPQNMTAQYNITVPAPGDHGETNYGEWTCTHACATQNNVSADTSANTVLGGTGNVVKWTPTGPPQTGRQSAAQATRHHPRATTGQRDSRSAAPATKGRSGREVRQHDRGQQARSFVVVQRDVRQVPPGSSSPEPDAQEH